MNKKIHKQVHILLHQCKNLAPQDKTGKSDPYVKFKMNGQKAKSSRKKKTLNPVWGEKGEEFSLNVNDFENDVIEVIVMDWDRFSRNDLIGATNIPLTDLYKHQSHQLDDWFALENPTSKKDCVGHVHLRISLDDGKNKEIGHKTKQRRQSLLQREEQKLDVLSACVGTWNVGNAPPPDDLTDWIPKDGYHVFILGAQECEYKPREPYQNCSDDWIACLRKHFGSDYILVKECSLLEMRIVAFASREVMGLIKNIHTGKEATGLAHVYGNKGGTAISFNVLGTRLGFVSSHLAAHQDKTSARNANYSEIVHGLKIGVSKQDIMNQFHHLFWLGDLNYRLNYPEQDEKEREPTPEIFKLLNEEIANENWEQMFVHDQLAEQMKADKAFVGFEEGDYNFKPTFKVKRTKEVEYNEKRTPSWCDRIMWKNAPGFDLTQSSLEGCPDIATSDHKPVRSTFNIPILPSVDSPDKSSKKKSHNFITIKSLKGADLVKADPNGKSDPYVIFVKHAPLDKQFTTPVIEKTLNPEWEDVQIPRLDLNIDDSASLIHSFILLRVMDADKVSADDAIGQGMLSLRDATRNAGAFIDFVVYLTHHGLPAGTLSGKIKLLLG